MIAFSFVRRHGYPLAVRTQHCLLEPSQFHPSNHEEGPGVSISIPYATANRRLRHHVSHTRHAFPESQSRSARTELGIGSPCMDYKFARSPLMARAGRSYSSNHRSKSFRELANCRSKGTCIAYACSSWDSSHTSRSLVNMVS
jgi:hypothetical protein